ncbi:unnamed protein product [Prorocentrum cordatum]|uniref:Armadillo repeat-containing protein 8 n=1 Tax=Prorocentrum cordatum TaxID=2364126 RepID=A0ABN9U9M3_9DINO|nr:unnamed protein product [Polarella glacialis]
MVARALARLSRSNGNNKAQMVHSGAIPLLVALLESEDGVVRGEAAAALSSLAANNEDPGYAAEIRSAANEAQCSLQAVDLAQAEAPVLLHIYDVSGDARRCTSSMSSSGPSALVPSTRAWRSMALGGWRAPRSAAPGSSAAPRAGTRPTRTARRCTWTSPRSRARRSPSCCRG